MAVPKVAIVGRPNVGKSSIFNWLIGRRVAIVDPTSGVTRDRVAHLLEEDGRYFEIVDTGGMGVEDKDGLTKQIESQIQHAIDEASVIVFVVDGRTGLTGLDQIVIKRLRACNKRVLHVANKCDNKQIQLQAAADFHRFGADLLFTSVHANRNKEELLEAIVEALPPQSEQPEADVAMKLAVVGKRNAGKSTFINSLANSERVIVSEVPGTTRDSIDVRFERNDQTFIAIDTAGVRKKKSLADSIEFYSYTRAQQSIRRADVVLLFIDPTIPIGRLDKQLADFIASQYKPCIFVINKWDLMVPMTTGEYNEYLDRQFPMLTFAPRAFITAKTGKNTQQLLDLAQSLYNQCDARVSTADLNALMREALSRRQPAVRQNKRPKIFYATQVATKPPTLVLFCNDPKLIDASYERYLLNFCRDSLPFAEVPIKMYLRKRDSHGGGRGKSDFQEQAEWQPLDEEGA